MTIERVARGEIVVATLGTFKDVKLWPGGGRAIQRPIPPRCDHNNVQAR